MLSEDCHKGGDGGNGLNVVDYVHVRLFATVIVARSSWGPAMCCCRV